MFKNLNSANLMKDLFRREENVYWDLTTGLVGIRTKDGIFTGLEEEDGNIAIQQNVFEDFGMKLPAYSMKVKLSDVKVSDIVAGESIVGFVEKVNESSLNIRKLNGQLTTGYRPPKVNVTIANGDVRVIRPLFSFGAQEGGEGNFLAGLQSNPILMMMMMNDNTSEKSFDKIMPLLLMGGLNGGQSPFGKDGNMLQMLLMLKMFGDNKAVDIDKAFLHL